MSIDNSQPPIWPPPPDVPPKTTAGNTGSRMHGWLGLLICGLVGTAGGIIIGLVVVAGMVFQSADHADTSGWPEAVLIAVIVGGALGFVPGLFFWCVLRAIEGMAGWLDRRNSRK